jgi:predicted dithiol-disulfide oxidoreductase (DUF899 family)
MKTVTFPNESTEYRAARERLLAKEIELRRAMEAVAAARRALPPGGLIPEDYVFDGLGHDGKAAKIKFSDLFVPGKNSLIIYHFMFPRMPQDHRAGPKDEGWAAGLKREDMPCPSCTALIDTFEGLAEHLEEAGYNFVVVAKTPLDRLLGFAKDRGWQRLRMLSAAGNNFKHDYHSETPEGYSLPIITVFHRYPDGIRHFWTSELTYLPPDPGQDSRQNGTIEVLWNMMDYTPEGRAGNWHEQLDYECCHDGKK